MGFLELRRQCGVSHEVRRGVQVASRVATGKSGLHGRGSSKASILRCSAFFIVQLSHLTTGKTIVLTRWTFVGKVISLLFNMLFRLVIDFLPRKKCLLIFGP